MSKKFDLKKTLSNIFTKENTQKIFKTLGRTFLTLFLIFVLTGCIVAASLTIYILNFVDTEADLEIDKESLNYTSIVYGLDKNGEFTESERIWAGENRIWVDYDKIPQNMKDAVVAVEEEVATTPAKKAPKKEGKKEVKKEVKVPGADQATVEAAQNAIKTAKEKSGKVAEEGADKARIENEIKT